MFEKQWVVYATNHETGFLDYVASYRTEWSAIRACERLQRHSIKEFGHLGNGIVRYCYEPCEKWAERIGDANHMHPLQNGNNC